MSVRIWLGPPSALTVVGERAMTEKVSTVAQKKNAGVDLPAICSLGQVG